VDLIRRNTDYALRLAAALAAQYNTGKVLSARALSRQNNVSYPLTCKLLQKYQQAGIIKSTMGPRGGFGLARPPLEITLLELIEIIQGPIRANRCLLGTFSCPMKVRCPLHPKLVDLQEEIERHLRNTTLAEMTVPQDNISDIPGGKGYGTTIA
jgi:Rrf2 family transcriptional regulator, iron-sulfur cluster assembly transcription factor